MRVERGVNFHVLSMSQDRDGCELLFTFMLSNHWGKC